MEEKKPTTYEKLSSSLPNRPQWIDTLPDDANGVHFMVGLSNAHPSEKEAREDAMRHAREQYAKYTGVDVSQVDAVFKALHGLESGVKDAMVTQA
ncbi:MAG: SIMPL domain-containing protein, partial [Desulfovibrionales bacterium]|nr:SIMPL domain-containing protein [Desulfovibrionales bacterium]